MLTTLLISAALAATPAPVQAPDTLHLEVGSPEVDGRIFPPHRARNTVYIGDSPTPVNSWTNELTFADSAGIRVMRWATRGMQPNGATWELLQSYDARTLRPLRWSLTSSAGTEARLRVEGTRVRGTWKGPSDGAPVEVDRTIPRPGFIASASDLVPMAVQLREGLVITAPVWSPQDTLVHDRVFAVLGRERVTVEGTEVIAWKVEERDRATGALEATWWLSDASPYMVLGETLLPDGRTRRITGVALP